MVMKMRVNTRHAPPSPLTTHAAPPRPASQTLMAGLVGLWVEAERPEDVPPAANVHKLLTSTRVWLTKYHRHREKHDSFANHPNCKGCRG